MWGVLKNFHMKNIAFSAIYFVFFPIFLLAQPITKGEWTATPYPDQMVRLTWTHPTLQNNEQISNAVIQKAVSAAIPATGSTAQWKALGLEVKPKGNGIEVVSGKISVKLTNAFDSGHIRGLQFTMPGNAPWLGGGERALPMVRNGQRISLYNGPAYGYGEGQNQLNYSVPFIMTTGGYGLFFDNPSKGYIDFGKTTNGTLEAAFESGSLDVYIIPGATPSEILKKFSTLTGRQPLPPRWALGNFVSRFGYYSQKQAEDVVSRMKKDGFPMDAIIIDLFWFGDSIQHTLGNLDWNKPKWPAPEKMIQGFAKSNIKTILITEPFTIEGTREYNASLPHLATDITGKPYRLTQFYFGKGGIIDLFRKPAQQWFWQFYKRQSDIGVAGWWGDLGEPEHHPEDVMHNMSDLGITRKMSANEVHNIYGHFWSQMVFENWKKDYPDKRSFFLNRAGYAGSQRFSIFPWTGDVARNWSGFRAQLPILQSMSLSGVPFIHSDAGGFAMTDVADPELYTRWLQFAAYTPIFRPHGSALEHLTPLGTISLPSEPTFWDDKTKERSLKLINDRYHLLPYNYTMAWEHLIFGKPLIRPMVFEQTGDSNLIKATDQYMWGSSLLVAPVLEPEATTRKLYLPYGKWYRFHDLSELEGGQWIEEKTSMETIPVFAKGGSFIPYWEKKQFTSTTDYNWKDTVAIRYFPGHSLDNYYLYDDDGSTPNAETKLEQHQSITFSSNIAKGVLTIKGNYTNWPPMMKRVLKFQIPAGALKNVLSAGETDKFDITVNGMPYLGKILKFDSRQDVWMNLYLVTDGLSIEIKVVKK